MEASAYSMAAFALAMSISPGPANMITLSAGSRYGTARTMPFVAGATLGFTALLLFVGVGAHIMAERIAILEPVLGIAGAVLTAYFGWRIATAPTHLEEAEDRQPSFGQGAALQWVNPKAWAACLAAVSLFELTRSYLALTSFAALYCAICFIGVGAWAVLGSALRVALSRPGRMRLFNIAIGGTLIVLAVLLGRSAIA